MISRFSFLKNCQTLLVLQGSRKKSSEYCEKTLKNSQMKPKSTNSEISSSIIKERRVILE